MENMTNEKTLNWLKDGVSCLTGWMLVAVGIGVAIYGFFQMRSERSDEPEQHEPTVQDVPFKVVEEA